MEYEDIKVGMKIRTCRGSAQDYSSAKNPWQCIGECKEACCKVIHTVIQLRTPGSYTDAVIVEPKVLGCYNSDVLRAMWIIKVDESEILKSSTFNRFSYLED